LSKVAGYKHGRVPRVIREKQILDIAEQQFILMGYESTTVESVRLAAGVSRPIIYEYYGSKDDLYLACAKRVREQYETCLIEIWNHEVPFEESMQKASNLYFSLIEENPKRWQILFSGTSAPMSGELGEKLRLLRKKTIDLMKDRLQNMTSDVDPERADAFSHAIFAIGDHLGQWWLNNPNIPKFRVVGHHVAFIKSGLSDLLK